MALPGWRFFLSLLFFVSISLAALLLKPEIELSLALRESPAKRLLSPSIVMLGDSHVEFVNWRLLMHCETIANYGVGGNSTAQILARLSDVLAFKPRLVILMAGTNDARRYVPQPETAQNLDEIRARVVESGADFVSIAPPPLPSRGSDIDVSVKAAMMRIPFTVADLATDKIHLRRSGYAKWRDAIAPLVRKYC